jgi:hypothetical protein
MEVGVQNSTTLFVPDLASYSHVAGGAVSKVDPDSTGLNPFWRKALVHVTWRIGWEEGTHANEIKRLRTGLAHTLQNITNLTGSSAYFNEVRLLTWLAEMQIFTSALGLHV